MVQVEGLVKRFQGERGPVPAVEGISFTVPEGRFFTLLGPSGCGKSTTLRCLAGLESPDDGEIQVGGEVVFSRKKGVSVPPHKRNIGMVFQSYAIWPHMTVFDNVAYPLRVRKSRMSSREIRDKVEKALELVQLTGLESRPAPYLSGGQQQRLAVARALVREPKVLLLDEPLSNLDAKLREHMRLELRELQRRLGITTVYVTHDQLEALALSDIIAVMEKGQIVQVSSPREIYEKPGCRFVADFFGSTNFLPGRLAGAHEGDLARVETPQGLLYCPIPDTIAQEEVVISIRPENIEVLRTPVSGEKNLLEGKVEAVAFLGEFLDCQFSVGGRLFRGRVHTSINLRRGETVYLRFPPQSCMVLAQ